MEKLINLICNNLFNVQYPIISCYIKPIVFMNSNKNVYETIVKNSDLPTRTHALLLITLIGI